MGGQGLEPNRGVHEGERGVPNCYAKTLHDRWHEAYLDGKRVPGQYASRFEMVQR